ncbi:Protein of uncharacterised function (DUF3379) [Aeromonas encheleia]|uniref:DUF3379 domain-containing protein n=1 Tax=Aeromonas encheleia TaxID=73010 RepID=UPI0005B21D92|nr:DUF3379 domain-containing protein [Aeromonas encheleia]VEG96453.1 Protein of uncharacterised function (DUF3379) [Aeromonas encheleia]
MDELEFRRRAIAHPMDQDPAFLDAAQTSPANRKHLDEMKQLDRQLQRTLEVEVPAGLAERILLRQAMEADDDDVVIPLPPPPARTGWRPLAIAASVAFLLGISTRWISWPPTAPVELSLAQVAMAHVYGEEPFIKGVDERVSLQTINAKMEKYGATLMGMQDMKVTYVNHCSFYQGPALHMVIQGKMGPVTLFLVPKHVPLSLQPSFEDGQLKGEIVPLKGANMVLIGDMQESLEPVAAQFESRLHWSI